MHPDDAERVSVLERFRRFLEAKLGRRYGAIVSLADRAVTSFLIAFAAKFFAGDVFDVRAILHLSFWTTAGFAGAAALASTVKSGIMTAITGDPALLSLGSATLRARRGQRRVAHRVPIRSRRPSPRPLPERDLYTPEHAR